MQSIEDVFGQAVIHDTVYILPTLPHAIVWWPRLRQYADDHSPMIRTTKTSIILPHWPRRVIKLWVPYDREPTMPMDHWRYRRVYWPASTWYTDKELKRFEGK